MLIIWRKIYCCLLICLSLCWSITVEAVEIGQVTKLSGRADVVSANKKAKALRIGDAIYEQDIIRTKKRTLLIIKMKDGSRLTLGERTRLAVSEYTTGNKPTGKLQLFRGRVRAFVSSIFSKRRNSFKMRTSTAVVGVQGTDFSVISQALATKIYVYEGLVTVNNLNPNIRLKRVLRRNQATIVKRGQPPLPPTTIKPTRSMGSGGVQNIRSEGDQSNDPAGLTSSIPVVPIPLPPIPTPPPR